MVIDEDNFIPELRNGNTRALECIVETYSNLVFKVVINVLGSDRREYAKECINDVFLLVWNKINLYDPIKSSETTATGTLIIFAAPKNKEINMNKDLQLIDEKGNSENAAGVSNMEDGIFTATYSVTFL